MTWDSFEWNKRNELSRIFLLSVFSARLFGVNFTFLMLWRYLLLHSCHYKSIHNFYIRVELMYLFYLVSCTGISKLTVRTQSPVGGLSPGKKPAIGVKPSVAKETAGPSVKPIKPVVSRQYNSPIGLYSETKVTEAREEQTKEVHEVHTGSANFFLLSCNVYFNLVFFLLLLLNVGHSRGFAALFWCFFVMVMFCD